MTALPSFRPYQTSDQVACLALFDANCPEFFDPSERSDYLRFLASETGQYQVCLLEHRIVGAYGVGWHAVDGVAIRWILIDPDAKGQRIGSAMMARALSGARSIGARRFHMAASHKSAPFFARFGARVTKTTDDGWGPGLHRVDMELVL